MGIEINWKFCATSHGKGPVDGIGGAVKRYVWAQVLARKDMVKDASSFVSAAAQMLKVEVAEITADDIDKRNQAVKVQAIFDKASPVVNVASMHHFQVTNDTVSATALTKDVVVDNSDDTVKVGDWCAVEYNVSYHGIAH